MWYIVLSHSLPEKETDKQENYEEHRQWLDDQHRWQSKSQGKLTLHWYGGTDVFAAELLESAGASLQRAKRASLNATVNAAVSAIAG